MSIDLEKERLATLAQRLAAATARRDARWQLSDGDVYVWGAAEGTVTVASRDGDGEPPYELSVHNSGGEKVDELASELLLDDQPAPWNDALVELYRVARRSALGADDIIDALMDRLRGPEDEEASSARTLLRRARAGASARDLP
jgi:hypothetical protein